MSDLQIRALARRLANLERQALLAKQPTLGHSTVQGGAIQVTDDADTLVMIVGQQFDGTRTAAVVAGPTPPVPTMPLAAQTFNGIRCYWDGTFVNDAVAPMDFQRVTVHATTDSDPENLDPLDSSKYVGEITSAAGGEVFASLPVGVEQFIFLVCWSQAGAFSDPSVPDFATPGAITATEIEDGSITTPKLAANAITATKIAADAIDGMTITGPTIQTAASGSRIVIDSAVHTDRISLHQAGGETSPGRLSIGGSQVALRGLEFTGKPAPSVTLTNDSDEFELSNIHLDADLVSIVAPDGVMINDSTVKGIHGGSYSDTTDGSGQIVVNHDLGITPASVVAMQGSSGPGFRPLFAAASSTTFTLVFRRTTDNTVAAASTAVSGRWIAFV